MANSWISKAVADQRQGRAGRLREGECYRLYSRSKYETFNTFPIPDVLRIPLESLVIHVKVKYNIFSQIKLFYLKKWTISVQCIGISSQINKLII